MKRITREGNERKGISPKRAESQRDFLLKILRQAGSAGVSKIHFLQGSGPCDGRLVTQVSARIVELEAEGYRFEHRRVEGSDFVTFVLLSEPNHQQKSVDEPTQIALGLAPTCAQSFVQHETGGENLKGA